MATNGQSDFRLRIHTLELTTTSTGYVTRILDTFDIRRNDIEYRAEGNANIVLAIPHRCQVLRLPKIVKWYVSFFIRSSSYIEICYSVDGIFFSESSSFDIYGCRYKSIKFVCIANDQVMLSKTNQRNYFSNAYLNRTKL